MKTHQLRSLHKFFVGFSNNSFEGMKTHQNRSKSILQNHMCFGRGDQVGPQPLFYYRKLSFPPRKINLQQSESLKCLENSLAESIGFSSGNVQPKKYLCNIGKSTFIPPQKNGWHLRTPIALSIGRGFGHPPFKKENTWKSSAVATFILPSTWNPLKPGLPVVN